MIFDEDKMIELINSFPRITKDTVIHVPVPKDLTLDEYMERIAEEVNNRHDRFMKNRWNADTKMLFMGIPVVLDTAIDKLIITRRPIK